MPTLCYSIAMKNCCLPFPRTRITVNLAPADIKKEGSRFDLAIAVAVLAAAVAVVVCVAACDVAA